jgi:hypothetical protein
MSHFQGPILDGRCYRLAEYPLAGPIYKICVRALEARDYAAAVLATAAGIVATAAASLAWVA